MTHKKFIKPKECLFLQTLHNIFYVASYAEIFLQEKQKEMGVCNRPKTFLEDIMSTAD